MEDEKKSGKEEDFLGSKFKSLILFFNLLGLIFILTVPLLISINNLLNVSNESLKSNIHVFLGIAGDTIYNLAVSVAGIWIIIIYGIVLVSAIICFIYLVINTIKSIYTELFKRG